MCIWQLQHASESFVIILLKMQMHKLRGWIANTQQLALAFCLQLAQAEGSDESKVLAELIVQVLSFIFSSFRILSNQSTAQELHYFVLAVSQAGTYIHCHSSFSEHRGLLGKGSDHE